MGPISAIRHLDERRLERLLRATPAAGGNITTIIVV
jgi:hypothetical protein